MIVNKKIEEVYATVCYEVKYCGLACDDEVYDEEVKVKNFNALIQYLGDFGINEIRKEHENADSIKVVGISIYGKKTENIGLTVNLFNGSDFNAWASVEIDNQDIDNRLLTNIGKVKQIIDNTLEQYPIKY